LLEQTKLNMLHAIHPALRVLTHYLESRKNATVMTGKISVLRLLNRLLNTGEVLLPRKLLGKLRLRLMQKLRQLKLLRKPRRLDLKLNWLRLKKPIKLWRKLLKNKRHAMKRLWMKKLRLWKKQLQKQRKKLKNKLRRMLRKKLRRKQNTRKHYRKQLRKPKQLKKLKLLMKRENYVKKPIRQRLLLSRLKLLLL